MPSPLSALFSVLLNNESLTLGLLLFVVLAIVGSVIASLPGKLRKRDFRLSKGIVWPFIAAICIGLSDTISKGYINKSSDFSFLFVLGIVQIPVAVAYLRIEKQKLAKSLISTVKKYETYKYALLGGLFNIVGTGFLWLSFSYAPASIASPITGANGALTVLFARFAFSERLDYRKYAGIALTFIGVVGMAILRS